MEVQAYKDLQRGEESWWYRGRIFFIKRLLSGISVPKGRSLDFGSGFGGMHDLVSTYGIPDAFEINPEAAQECCKRGYARVITERDELEKEGPYQLIGAFDVIEHLEDDAAAMRLFHDRLGAGGVMVATVPAFSFLWSKHDELNHHFRRYSLPEITRLFVAAGFVDVRATYWNMTLFPVAFLLRLIGRGGGDALTPARPINWLLTQILRFESFVIPHVALPFGVGIVITGRKPDVSGNGFAEESNISLPWRVLIHPVFLFSFLCNYRLVHFLSVGSLGALLNLFLTWFFTTFVFGQAQYLDAFVIGITGNLIFNFTFNTLITFKTQKKHLRRFFGFVAYSLLMAGVQYLTVRAITPLIGIDLYLWVIAGVILAYSFLNFVFFKYILFREVS
jgi:putative flippase GtrA